MNHLRILLVAGFTIFTLPSVADTLRLSDGSVLHGTVVRQQDGRLTFSTVYAGDITVDWGQVVEVQADTPIGLYLGNGELVSTRTITRNGTQLEVGTPDGVRTLADAELRAINPDAWERGDGYRLSGRINLALDTQNGNTDKEELGMDGEVRLRRQHDRLVVAGQFEQDESDGTSTAENWLLNGKYDYFVTDKWYYGGSLKLEHDRFADLNLRTALGPHIGYQFFESEPMNLSTDVSLLYVTEDFDIAMDDEYSAFGWSVDFDRLLTGHLQLYHRHTGQLEAGDAENVVVNTWTGLRAPLYAGVIASAEAQVDYDGGAPAAVDKVDTIYRIKLGYAW